MRQVPNGDPSCNITNYGVQAIIKFLPTSFLFEEHPPSTASEKLFFLRT